MGSFSLVHWIVLILVIMLLFGRGKISELMGDFAKGINSFKKGLADEEQRPATMMPPPQVTHAPQPVPPAQPIVEEPRT